VITLSTALACLAFASPACAAPPEKPVPAAEFAISYERGGGFAPMPRKLVIRPVLLGTVTEVRQAPNDTWTAARRFRVRPKTAEGLRRALARADFASIESPSPDTGCSDCFLYEIRYRGHEVRFDQVSVPGRLHGVLDRLEAIAEAHRPFH
jgi:hypothetical protein